MRNHFGQLSNPLETAFLKMEHVFKQLETNRRLESPTQIARDNLIVIKQEARESAKRLAQLEELVKTSSLLTSSLNVRLTLDSVIDAIIYLAGMARAYIMLYDESREVMTPQVARNWNQETLSQQDITFSQTIIQRVVKNKQPLVWQDAQKEFNDVSSVRALGLNTVMCTPLIVQEILIGVIYADSCDRDRVIISPGNVPLMQAFAAQAAIAISNARLFDQLQQSREHIVFARDEERRRLGLDLHDGLTSDIAGMMYRVGAVENYLAQGNIDKVRYTLADLKNDLKIATENSRRIAHNLYPVNLEQQGLIHALQDRASRYEARFAVSWTVPIQMPTLPAAVELAVYHMVIEAFNNIVRYAKAHHCSIELNLTANTLHLEIADDGQGIPDNHTAGVGLGSIRERAAELGGTCTIISKRATGTRLIIHLPLIEKVIL